MRAFVCFFGGGTCTTAKESSPVKQRQRQSVLVLESLGESGSEKFEVLSEEGFKQGLEMTENK